MTVSSATSRISYSGNGTTTAFSFPYYFLADADLVVILRVNSTGVETTKTITTHYTLAGAGVAAGGTVTMVTAPASGETLIIYRDPALTQATDWVENDPAPAETKEAEFDKLTMIAQRLSNRLDRALRLTDGFSASFTMTLPVLVTTSYFLRVNSTGDGWVLSSGTAGNASDVIVTPTGNLAANDVQEALEELQTDINNLHKVTNSRASPGDVVAGTAIIPAGVLDETIFVQGSGGAVTVSANPQIAVGTTVGDRLTLIGRSDTNTLTYANGTGLVLNGALVLRASSVVSFIWDGTNWVERSRNDV
ncbi:tail fiber protein [Caudoviricetes sp.]|nr:tail fiber protein [Caudoviricetes sp.]